METQVKDVNSYTKELIVSLTPEEKKQYDKQALKKVKKKAELPGFRKGKVPEPLVKQHFAYEIENESISIAMDDLYPKAVDEHDLNVVAPGKLKDIKNEEDKIQFVFEVVVEPEIELKKVKGLELKRIKTEVKEEHVEKTLQELREKYATVMEKEDAAAEGDNVEFDMQEVDENNVPLVGKKYDNISIQIGKNEFDEALEKQLIGLKAGDSRVLVKEYPEDFEDEAWRGKKEYFKVDVKKVFRKEIPELNDEFAQTVSDQYNTLQDLVEDVRKRLKENLENQEKEQFYQEIVQKMIEENPFDVPPEMVENYLDHIVEDVKRQYQGAKIEDNVLREYYRKSAETSVKWYLIKKKIIEMENITVSDEEAIQKLDEIPNIDEKTKEQLKQYPAYLNSIKEDLLEEKVFQFIIDNAEVKEVTPEELEKETEEAQKQSKEKSEKKPKSKKDSKKDTEAKNKKKKTSSQSKKEGKEEKSKKEKNEQE